jgi:glutathione S-transferase
MIELHGFAPAWGISPSPFCLKVDVYCRMAGIPVRPVATLPFRAPRGKLPFIVDNGARIPDSGQILAHLRRNPAADLDAGLDGPARSRGHLLRRLCEESLYFVMVYSRWIDPAGWRVMRPALFGAMPPGLRDVAAILARRGIRRQLRAQGTARHTRAEVYAFGAADLEAIAEQLRTRPFAAGQRPSSFDATVYAFLLSIVAPPVETPLKHYALRCDSLSTYRARMEANFGPVAA